MTSSATPSDAPAEADPERRDAADERPEPADADAPADAPDADDADDGELDDDEADDAATPPVDAAAARGPWWWRHMPRLVAIAAVIVGWSFIGWHERFRIAPPSVVLCLGWLAVVEAVLFLWRAGFEAADEGDEDALWWKPRGERDELEREKRSLLKAIKEIEFDREMGKTSDADAGEIVRMYRARAIEVIKALDALSADGAEDVRAEIEREVRARVRLAGGRGKTKRAAKKKPRKAEDAS